MAFVLCWSVTLLGGLLFDAGGFSVVNGCFLVLLTLLLLLLLTSFDDTIIACYLCVVFFTKTGTGLLIGY